MPPRREPTEERDLTTQVAVIIEKMKNLETLAYSTAQDMRTMKDSNFIRTVDMNTVIDKMQSSFATKGELSAARQDLDSLMADRAKVGWFIVLAVLGAVLSLVIMNKGIRF